MEVRIGPDLVLGKLAEVIKPLLPPDDVWVLCIGTDRSTGDSFGPLTGTFLKQLGFVNVLGTLHEPVCAVNLNEYISRLYGKFVIAVDAGLGLPKSVGTVVVRDYPIKPGYGVGKKLPEVGDVSIMALVNVAGFMEYMTLSNTKLSVVWDMAEYVSRELCVALDR